MTKKRTSLSFMAPKKKDEGPKERPVLGRFRSNLKVSYTLGLIRPLRVQGACMSPRKVDSHYQNTTVQVGIVGLPNVGKSTLFNTLTKMAIPAENFPFCTIEPNNVRSAYLYRSSHT